MSKKIVRVRSSRISHLVKYVQIGVEIVLEMVVGETAHCQVKSKFFIVLILCNEAHNYP